MKPFTLHLGDCIEVMRGMADGSVDSIVTDPPYHLTTGKKGGTGPASVNLESPYGRARIGTGFMGMKWDGGDIAFSVELWTEVWRVLKPGGHLLAFSGTRTQHRMVCAIEDAGFEVRDQIGWAYGSGFPKSRNISADMTEGADDWEGWGTALKPAWEPICVARKPLAKGMTVAANVLAHGTGAINIDVCRVGDEVVETHSRGSSEAHAKRPGEKTVSESGRSIPQNRAEYIGNARVGRWPANLIHDGSDEVVALFPDSNGSGAARALKRGTREGEGWGMADEIGELRDAGTGSAARFFYCAKASRADRNAGLDAFPPGQGALRNAKGRPMNPLCSTTGKRVQDCDCKPTCDWIRPEDTSQNTHPTVKPTDLMAYLCRLVTPPGGLVLDPFMGSGSTGKAAMREGFRFIGIDMTAEYIGIATARIEHELAVVTEANKPKPTPPQADMFAA